MSEFNYDRVNATKEKRPTFLSVLCILSFIWTGLNGLGGLFSMVFGSPNQELAEDSKMIFYNAANQMREAKLNSLVSFYERLGDIQYIKLTDKFYVNNFIETGVYLLGFFAVFLMFKQNKKGFHGYILYSILASLSQSLIFGFGFTPISMIILPLVFGAIWVFLYFLNLKKMY